eukprot:scaffold1042_cov401-Prasinococcus_capsulatus_cf.AAC.39
MSPAVHSILLLSISSVTCRVHSPFATVSALCMPRIPALNTSRMPYVIVRTDYVELILLQLLQHVVHYLCCGPRSLRDAGYMTPIRHHKLQRQGTVARSPYRCWLAFPEEDCGLVIIFSFALTFDLAQDRRIRPARDKQARSNLRPLRGPQLMLQAFGECFYCRLAYVICQVSGWHSYALLGSGGDDKARLLGSNHVRHKGLCTVDDTP